MPCKVKEFRTRVFGITQTTIGPAANIAVKPSRHVEKGIRPGAIEGANEIRVPSRRRLPCEALIALDQSAGGDLPVCCRIVEGHARERHVRSFCNAHVLEARTSNIRGACLVRGGGMVGGRD